MKKTVLLIAILAYYLLPNMIFAQENETPEWARETREQKAKRMAWWTHDRFGMFIHWGLYSLPSRHEWVQHYERMTAAEYSRYFENFNPDLYTPREWAKIAKAAGMKYVVVGTKHHEGFCMFDSKYTDFKITNTSYSKDIIRELVDAFRAEGLRIGFYYSLIDWHHPDFPYDWMHPECPHLEGGTMMQIDTAATEKANETRNIKKYQQYIKNQLTELMTNYGQIDELFLDFSYYEKGHKQWDSEGLLKLVRKYQPQIIVDDRMDLNNTTWGWDFTTPEQTMPDKWETRKNPKIGLEERVPWETCQTFSGSWGYHREETSWKSNRQMISMLIEVVSKGGNLLLNVGPTSRGLIDDRAHASLKSMAEWMAVNSRSIYGCTEAPEELSRTANTILTYNTQTKTLYIHILDWPTFKSLRLKNYSGKIQYAQLLNDGSEIQFKEQDNDVILSLPLAKPNTEIPVIEVFLK
ncbi:MAG: alpha-L-fucosidase [Dysgonamonadaceae bacterium]|jgi:alpha-L-fucosidase|nr:alpha-L-fucosidase [Dysgonamonadaceae bacterium]